MKNSPNNQRLATLALFVAGIIGGLMPVVSKIVLRELPPLTVLFVSLLVMVLAFSPGIFQLRKRLWQHKKSLLLFGLLWMGNITLFIIGVQYTTAVASQILYASVPILILVEQHFVVQEKIKPLQLAGIAFGFFGVLVFALGSLQGKGDFGSFLGNVLIFLGAFSWTTYLLYSKRLSTSIRPIELTMGSAVVGFFVSALLMFWEDGLVGLSFLSRLTLTGWSSLLFIAFGVRVAMILLYNWGIKYGSSIVAGSMVYVATFTTALVGTVFLHEYITLRFMLGALLVLLGVFFTSTFSLIAQRHNHKR